MPFCRYGVAVALLFFCKSLAAQQIPDTLFTPNVTPARYSSGNGPVVTIDEAHHNFHTATNRFKPFANLVENDGYQVRRGTEKFSRQSLRQTDILVVSNALNEKNVEEWVLPNPSAFTDDEIESVRQWVTDGGSLLLIADHMPFPGAAEKLASVFGFTFYNGFALTDQIVFAPELFCYANNRLKKHQVLAGLDSILTFTGQGFGIPPNATPILALDKEFYMLLPERAWAFDDNTKRMEGQGKYQGALLSFGKGKVAVFGEAASFSAQIAQGMFHMGFNHPHARHNAQLALNIIHWLE